MCVLLLFRVHCNKTNLTTTDMCYCSRNYSNTALYSIVAVSLGVLADHIGLVLTLLIAQGFFATALFFFHRGVVRIKD